MKKIYYAVLLIAGCFTACKKEAVLKNEAPDVHGKTIIYHLKNGGQVTVFVNLKNEYVVGGDVILSKQQIAYLEQNKVENKGAITESTFTGELQKLWPGGVIYYTINDAGNSQSIQAAINEWEAYTPIRFVQRTSQSNYIDFSGQPEQGAGDSQLGMVGGRQQIRLVANAGSATVIHEIGHAVGLMHEQTRADRDQYINVNYSNINSNWTDQYNTYDALGRSGSQMGSFDFNSIMLYPSYASAASIGGNGTPQMTRKDGSTWNSNSFLSQGDISGVVSLYKVIYYRIAYLTRDVIQQDDWNDSTDDYYELRFYSDAAHTQPFILTRGISFGISGTRRVYHFSEQGTTYGTYYEVTVPAGESTYVLNAIETRIQYNGNMGMQAGSYYDGLGTVTTLNSFGVPWYN